jgi:AcrR family transcriptional regulator
MQACPSPSPRPWPACRRASILQAAHDLFYREGIRATGVDRVIACAA